MGCRLHTQIKHEIEYDDSAYFNWGRENLEDILGELNVSVYKQYSDEGSDCNYEIAKEDFKEAIEKLEHLDSLGEDIRETIESRCRALDYSVSEILEIFSRIYTISDKRSGYIHLDWF